MIEGKQVRMRAIEERDLAFLREMTNHAYVAARVVGWDWPLSDFGQGRWWEKAYNDKNNVRLIVEDFDGVPLGMTGLWQIDWHNRSALTALKMHPDRVLKGMGTDAIKLVMAYTFYQVGLNRLWGAILDFNGPSFGAYVKKCNWKVEGVLREEIFRKGEFHDLYRVAALKREFDALPDAAEYIERVQPVDTEDKVNLPDDWFADELRQHLG